MEREDTLPFFSILCIPPTLPVPSFLFPHVVNPFLSHPPTPHSIFPLCCSFQFGRTLPSSPFLHIHPFILSFLISSLSVLPSFSSLPIPALLLLLLLPSFTFLPAILPLFPPLCIPPPSVLPLLSLPFLPPLFTRSQPLTFTSSPPLHHHLPLHFSFPPLRPNITFHFHLVFLSYLITRHSSIILPSQPPLLPLLPPFSIKSSLYS